MRVRTHRVIACAAALSLLMSANLAAQARPAAPNDLTGYWVSVVTELWRYRMLVPDKGDYTKIPLNPEGRKIANAWDPAKDRASGTSAGDTVLPRSCRSRGG